MKRSEMDGALEAQRIVAVRGRRRQKMHKSLRREGTDKTQRRGKNFDGEIMNGAQNLLSAD
jgi:hypothetical protein